MPDRSPTIAISSWSVHRALGIMYPNAPANDVAGKPEPKWGPGSLALTDLPAKVRKFGGEGMHICHFHLAGRDTAYLGEVRASLADAGVELQSLLIDDGDIAHPADHRRDIDWIGRWIDAAAELGAETARVIAGKQKPTLAALDLAVEGLAVLARRGKAVGVRVISENWFDLFGSPAPVDHVLDRLDGEVGLLADFGNWKGAGKYADLAAILGRAEDTHAKAMFNPGLGMDTNDYRRCLEAAVESGYDGPYTLIYEGPEADEWECLAQERDFVRDFFVTA